MPQITWKNLGDLDFSDSNDLRVQGSEMMANGAKTLVDTFKEVAAKNAVIEKEQRDTKFAGAIQNMSLAQDENQLRQSYMQAMQVDGIGADNVLKLTDTYKGYQQGIINLQGKRLDNTGQGLVNKGRQQSINYTSQTQPLQIQADNAKYKGIIQTNPGTIQATNSNNTLQVKQNNYKSSQIDYNTAAGLPQSDALTAVSKNTATRSNNAFTINNNDYKNTVLQNKAEANLPFLQAQQASINAQYGIRETQAKAKGGLPESNVAASVAKNNAARSNSDYTIETNTANSKAGLPVDAAITTASKNKASRSDSAYRIVTNEANVKSGLPESNASTKVSKNRISRSNDKIQQKKNEAYNSSGLIPLEIKGKTSDIKTKIGTNKFTNSKIKASLEAGLPKSEVATKVASNDLITAKAKQEKRILNNTKDAVEGAALNDARTKLVQSAVASENSFNNAQDAQDVATAKFKSEKAKYNSLDKNYYSSKATNEINKVKDAEELRKARVQAEKDKSAASKAKVRELERTARRKEIIASTVNEITVSSQNDKSLSPTRMYERALKKLGKSGKTLTSTESLDMFNHFTKVAKFEDRKVSTLKGTASKFATTDSTTKKYYDNLNNRDAEVVETVMSSLQASGSILDKGIVKRLPPNKHKDFMKGLIEFMSKNSDKFTPLTFDTTNAVNGYEKYVNQYFNKTVSESGKTLKVEE